MAAFRENYKQPAVHKE